MLRSDPRFDLFERHGLSLPDDAVFIGTEKGAVAFADYNGENVHIHMCGEKGWSTPQLLRSVWVYVWDVLGCRRCTALVREDRKTALRINLRLGFKVEGYMRHADHGFGVFVLGMLKEECRYGYAQGSKDHHPGPADADSAAGAG